MKTPAVCLIFLLSVILFKGSHAEPYEYLQFVLQYARGSCVNVKKCIRPASLPAKFTVHGIWPTNISKPEIECKAAEKLHRFNKKLITTSLKTDLLQSWPSVMTDKDDMWFWEHEYNKHGCCTAPAITQTAYFKRAHKFWKEYDLYSILKQKNIKPGQSRSYSLADFEAAVKSKIGTDTKPLILCKQEALTRGSTTTNFILREIVICFDHQGTNLVNCTRSTDCDQKQKTTKSSMIYYV
ncbi:ribonuclease S-7-like [Rosa rugosa]|uniref:ribonuclease S-7-like n=1 Tax=Rosa rugosa TaxID=74645 RepID=UPI002B40C35B|nr:ribonuclease S-7-like [Rosa rugosa]